MSNTCPKPRCGGLLVLDYEAGDEWVCRRCATRLYATKPSTYGIRTDPMYCPECGARVWGGTHTRDSVPCDDCQYVRRTLLILGTSNIPDRYGRSKAL